MKLKNRSQDVFFSKINLHNQTPNMKIVIISDTHDKLIKELPDGDILVHCGDYSLFGEYDETKTFFDWFSEFPHKHKIVIPGNHEVGICPRRHQYRYSNPNFDKTMALIKSYTSINFLIDEELIIEGVKFYGTPWCGGERHIMYRWGFYMSRDEQRAEVFKKIPDDTDILISHTPPYDILDKYDGRTLGCPALLERIKQVKPLVSCFGHIHSANGYIEKDGTHFFNCSSLGENYKIQYPCRVIEVQDKKLISNNTVKVYDSKHMTIKEKMEGIVAGLVNFRGQEYPPVPKKIDLPPSVWKPNPKDNETEDCIYCKVKLTKENYAFTTDRGSMCMRCHWQIFD